ncbi:hypothetical protein DV515_00016222, partial [Chloebia gouldiae]
EGPKDPCDDTGWWLSHHPRVREILELVIGKCDGHQVTRALPRDKEKAWKSHGNGKIGYPVLGKGDVEGLDKVQGRERGWSSWRREWRILRELKEGSRGNFGLFQGGIGQDKWEQPRAVPGLEIWENSSWKGLGRGCPGRVGVTTPGCIQGIPGHSRQYRGGAFDPSSELLETARLPLTRLSRLGRLAVCGCGCKTHQEAPCSSPSIPLQNPGAEVMRGGIRNPKPPNLCTAAAAPSGSEMKGSRQLECAGQRFRVLVQSEGFVTLGSDSGSSEVPPPGLGVFSPGASQAWYKSSSSAQLFHHSPAFLLSVR